MITYPLNFWNNSVTSQGSDGKGVRYASDSLDPGIRVSDLFCVFLEQRPPILDILEIVFEDSKSG